MRDPWVETEDLECYRCGGNLDCDYCSKRVLHFAGYAYRVVILLVQQELPKKYFAKFAEIMDKRNLWLKAGHYTICPRCEKMDLVMDDYLISHGKNGNEQILFVGWYKRSNDERDTFEEKTIYRVNWRSKEDE
jgi:hypothetical protein